MKHFCILFFVSFLFIQSFGQIQIPVLGNYVRDTSELKFQAIKPLIGKSSVVIMFRTYSAWGEGPFKVISFEADNMWHAYLLKDSTSYPSVINYNQLENKSASQDSIKNLWKFLVINKAFSLPEIPSFDTTCDYSIDDASHCDLRIIAKNKYKILDYYAPKYFEENCPGSLPRQTMVKIHNLFFKQQFFEYTR